MMKKCFFIIFILVFRFLVFGIQWPVKDFNKEHGISATLGGYRDGHVHDGTDIVAPKGTAVYSVEDGKVAAVDTDNKCSPFIKIGAYSYFHITLDKEFDTDDPIKKGQKIGEVFDKFGKPDNCFRPHVHLTESKGKDRLNLLNPKNPNALTPYTDTKSPKVKEVQFFYRENLSTALNLSIPLELKEISVEAYIRDYPSTSPEQDTAPYMYGYQVFDAKTDALLVDEYPKVTFDSWLNKDLKTIYPKDNYYWVTNKGNIKDYLDLKALPFAEQYKLCVLAQDAAGNGADIREPNVAETGAWCEYFKVLNSTFAWNLSCQRRSRTECHSKFT